MGELDALAKLAKLAQIDEASPQLRSCWNAELAWEREWIKQRHKGTRRQYELAVENTFDRMKKWLEGGYVLREKLAEHWLWESGTRMTDLELVTALAEWVGSTRPAAVWCSLWWLRGEIAEAEERTITICPKPASRQ